MVFLSIIIVLTFPNVSIPKDKGKTSNNKTLFASSSEPPPSLTLKISPCIAAPIATTFSGLIDLSISLLNKALTASLTAGIKVVPPTKIISSTSLGSNLASSPPFLFNFSRCSSLSLTSLNVCSTFLIDFSTKSLVRLLNSDLVIL